MNNWERLFGTPERAVDIAYALIKCRVVDCSDCVAYPLCRAERECIGRDELLEWLERSAE